MSGREHSTTCADLKTSGPHDFQKVSVVPHIGQLGPSDGYTMERCTQCGLPRYTGKELVTFRRDWLPGVPDV